MPWFQLLVLEYKDWMGLGVCKDPFCRKSTININRFGHRLFFLIPFHVRIRCNKRHNFHFGLQMPWFQLLVFLYKNWMGLGICKDPFWRKLTKTLADLDITSCDGKYCRSVHIVVGVNMYRHRVPYRFHRISTGKGMRKMFWGVNIACFHSCTEK